MKKDKSKQGELNKNNLKADSHNDSEKSWWQPAFILFARLSAWIVVPVVMAVVIGKWLDRKYESEPWMLLITVGLAFIISMIGIVKNTVKEYAKIVNDSKSISKDRKKNLKNPLNPPSKKGEDDKNNKG
jgi:F0F1-type ATP synthase assembly protein I